MKTTYDGAGRWYRRSQEIHADYGAQSGAQHAEDDLNEGPFHVLQCESHTQTQHSVQHGCKTSSKQVTDHADGYLFALDAKDSLSELGSMVAETGSSAEATAVQSPPPLSLISALDQIEWCISDTFGALYIAHVASGDLQWGGGGVPRSKYDMRSWYIPEPQNGCPAVTARCSDHKWTSHNQDHKLVLSSDSWSSVTSPTNDLEYDSLAAL